jgi:hypothetical protein
MSLGLGCHCEDQQAAGYPADGRNEQQEQWSERARGLCKELRFSTGTVRAIPAPRIKRVVSDRLAGDEKDDGTDAGNDANQ